MGLNDGVQYTRVSPGADDASCTSSQRDLKHHLLPAGHDLSYRSHSHVGSDRAGSLHWLAAAAVFYAFAMPSGVTGAGYMVGAVGYVFTVIIILSVTLATVLGSRMMAEVALVADDCSTFSDVGLVSFGRTGERVGTVIQFTNFILFLPVAIDLCADALGGALPSLFDCKDYYIFCVCLACLLTTQVRSVANTNLISYASCICIVIIAVIIISIVATHDPVLGAPDAQVMGNPASGFKGAVITMLGAAVIQWSFVPAFLTVELCHAMASPHELTKSLVLSGGATVVTMIVVGYATVSLWGWNLLNPIMASPEWNAQPNVGGLASVKIMNWLLLFANLTGYLLDSVCVGRACAQAWLTDFDFGDWSAGACLRYLLATIPSWLFGLAASLLVPGLFDMLAFTTCLTVPQACCMYPAACYYRYFIAKDGEGLKKRGVEATGWEKVGVCYVMVMGTLSFIACTIGAIGQVSYKDLRGPTQIGCKGWMILNDS
eukprot:Hpha_TRINITY_DN13073_c0_g1::TRINITY_DN13073_c0_g1_i1::g.68715::m.68715